MDYRIGTGGFAFAMTWRTLVAAGLALALLLVLERTDHYATALVLAALMGITIADAARLYGRLGQAMATPAPTLSREQARENDRMAALLDSVTVALIALGPDGRITYLNRAARLLAGEEVGLLSDIRALEGVAETILALPPGGRRIVALKDGRTLLAWTGRIAIPGQGEQTLVSLQMVTGELDAVQVKAWTDMTRILSHEMMNSLTPIASLSESLHSLLARNADPDLAQAAETISRRSRHLMQFVERYRSVADLPPARPAPIALRAFLAELDSLMRPHFERRGIAYESRLTAGGLVADAELLSQALLNLLHNAADAAAGGAKPVVILSCSQADNEVLFEVADNGPGIPAEHLSEIFVPFFTTKEGGSGIGLTLARQVALAHGGRIEAHNGDNGGACIQLLIPSGG